MDLQAIDTALLKFFYSAPEPVVKVALLFTQLSNAGITWVLVALLLIWNPKTRKSGLVLISALITQLLLIEFALKHAVGRLRPAKALEEIGLRDMLTDINSFSFPSGHSMVSFLGADFLGRRFPAWRAPLLVIALIIALSRPVVGAHYPSDIFVGAILGLTFSLIFSKLGKFESAEEAADTKPAETSDKS